MESSQARLGIINKEGDMAEESLNGSVDLLAQALRAVFTECARSNS